MKKLYAAIYALMLLCAVGTLVLLAFMPDTIPAHYNAAGEIDRYGSKYENLIWPGASALMGGFVLVASKHMRKKGADTVERILLYTGTFTLLPFVVMGFYFMLKAVA